MDDEHRDHSDRVGEGRGKRAGTRVEDLEVVMIVEEAEPGSALDDQLRREQTRVIFDLLEAARVGGGQQ